MVRALQTRIMQHGSGWYWEVIQGDEVIGQGVADTHAQARAEASKVVSQDYLDLAGCHVDRSIDDMPLAGALELQRNADEAHQQLVGELAPIPEVTVRATGVHVADVGAEINIAAFCAHRPISREHCVRCRRRRSSRF